MPQFEFSDIDPNQIGGNFYLLPAPVELKPTPKRFNPVCVIPLSFALLCGYIGSETT